MSFLEELDRINHRDCLIAKTILQGAKRKSEVLGLTIDRIDWDLKQISVKQKKTGGRVQLTVITYPVDFMEQLLTYLDGKTEGLVFITNTNSEVRPTQISRTFKQAGEKAGIPFKITPHVIVLQKMPF